MSEEQTTQAAVDETKVAAQPATEATGAQESDDLDSILKEFDDAKPVPSEPAKPATAAPAADDTKVASDTILSEAQFIRNERFKKDMNETIKEVRGDLPDSFFDNDFVQSWIDAQAAKDPRLGQAWAKRHDNPANFAKVKAALGKEFAKKYSKLPDAQATEDREAVTAAVRGASTRAPEGKVPDFSRMSNRELEKEWEKFT